MLTREQVETLLVARTWARADSCNSHHGNHVDGQIRALAAVLGDGSKPPAFDTLSEVYEFAGIPFTVHEDDTVEVPTEWLVAHGFVCRGDDDWYHPTLGRW